MGIRYADAVLLDLEATMSESDTRTPLICFLSMGSDPTNQIEGLAKKLHVECRAISMGQGQEVHARRLIGQFMQTVYTSDINTSRCCAWDFLCYRIDVGLTCII